MANSLYKQVAIVGAGLLGSMFVDPLVAHSVSLTVPIELTLVDYDKVEPRNSPANLGVPGNVGKFKGDVVSERIAASGIEVSRMKQRITEKNSGMLKKFDLVIGAVDNIVARVAIHKACTTYNIPYMDMGLSDTGGIVSWSIGSVNSMPFAVDGVEHKMPNKEKQPACELVATRVLSALVTECAAKSLFLYLAGSDPFAVVKETTGKVGVGGDLVGWNVVIGGGTITAIPLYLGNIGGVNDAQ